MSEITKTQAELDAFTAKQVMNWVGPICLILFVTDITFFLWGKIDTAKAAIALAGIAAFYFWCARGVKKNQKQAEGIKAGGGSHIPLLIITLLGMTAELTLTYQIANKAAEVFSLNKAPEPVQYAFWVILKLYLVYRMIMWIVYSFDRN
jgi:hypothetical protein